MAKKKKAAAPNNGAPRKRKDAEKKATVVAVQLPIKRHVSPDVKAMFANHVVIRSEPATFQMYFFEIQQPLIVDGDPDEGTTLSEMGYVDAHCVARVAIPHYVMPQLLKAFHESVVKQQQISEAFANREVPQKDSK